MNKIISYIIVVTSAILALFMLYNLMIPRCPPGYYYELQGINYSLFNVSEDIMIISNAEKAYEHYIGLFSYYNVTHLQSFEEQNIIYKKIRVDGSDGIKRVRA
jgi:hypothetical protein